MSDGKMCERRRAGASRRERDDAPRSRCARREGAAGLLGVFPQMKRSPALAPLSRDHHVALVVARQLARADADGAAAAAGRFVEFLSGHELAHFALEEQVLGPVIPDHPRGRELAERMLEDHEYLRSAAGRLRDPTQPVSVEHLHQLGRRLRAHVQMEERELFPYLEQELDPAALEGLGARLADGHGEG